MLKQQVQKHLILVIPGKQFNDVIVEARSMGGFIDEDIDVVIIRTEKNKLFVEPK